MTDLVPAPAPTATPFAGMPDAPDGVIASLCRRAANDERLRARAPVLEIERALERAVRMLWTESRVKVFVPVLALRQVREELGAPEPAIEAATVRPGRVRPRRGDELRLDPRDELRV